MTDRYLPAATNFNDMPVKDEPTVAFPSMTGPWTVCPKCQGHGGWNLLLNQYRHIEGRPGAQHFQASCSQCWSWGWVKSESLDATCMHDFKEVKPNQPFRCWHTIKCTKCGETKSYSSDD